MLQKLAVIATHDLEVDGFGQVLELKVQGFFLANDGSGHDAAMLGQRRSQPPQSGLTREALVFEELLQRRLGPGPLTGPPAMVEPGQEQAGPHHPLQLHVARGMLVLVGILLAQIVDEFLDQLAAR